MSDNAKFCNDLNVILQHSPYRQSMSRKGNCWDNACAENFFGHLKEEFVRFYKLQTFQEAREVIDDYINFYNNEQRIQLKTELTPLESRYQFCA